MTAAPTPDVIDVSPDPEIKTPAAALVPVPVGGGQVAVEYQARMVMSPEDAAAQAQALEEMTRAVLKPDVHYGVIPGTQKPSLYKPGAEWLLKVYSLGHFFTREELDRDGGTPFGVTYRCHVTKLLVDGRTIEVATCDGYAGRDEANFKTAPWNTVIKMAQKRALVGACLQATGTSGMFTQDVEDYDSTQGGPALIDETDPWRDVLGNPGGWFDNRSSKRNPKAPDFKAKNNNAAWCDKGTDQNGGPGPLALWIASDRDPAPEGFIEAIALRDQGLPIDWSLLDVDHGTTGRGKTAEAATTNQGVNELFECVKACSAEVRTAMNEWWKAKDLKKESVTPEQLNEAHAHLAELKALDKESESGGGGAGVREEPGAAGGEPYVTSTPDPAEGPTLEEEAMAAAGACCYRCGSTRTKRVIDGQGRAVCHKTRECEARAEHRSAAHANPCKHEGCKDPAVEDGACEGHRAF